MFKFMFNVLFAGFAYVVNIELFVAMAAALVTFFQRSTGNESESGFKPQWWSNIRSFHIWVTNLARKGCVKVKEIIDGIRESKPDTDPAKPVESTEPVASDYDYDDYDDFDGYEYVDINSLVDDDSDVDVA